MLCPMRANDIALSCTATYRKRTGQLLFAAGSMNPLALAMGSVKSTTQQSCSVRRLYSLMICSNCLFMEISPFTSVCRKAPCFSYGECQHMEIAIMANTFIVMIAAEIRPTLDMPNIEHTRVAELLYMSGSFRNTILLIP